MDSIILKLLSILLAFGFLMIAFVAKLRVGTAINLASIFSGIWFLYLLPAFILIFDAPVNPLAVLFIFLCALAFSLGTFIFDWRTAWSNFTLSKGRLNFIRRARSNFLVVSLWISCLLGSGFLFLTMLANGWSLHEVLFDLLATSGRFAALRGNEGVEYGVIGTLSVFFTYLTATLGGHVYGARLIGEKRFIYLVLALVPGVLAMVIQSSKLIFLISISFFFGSFLLMRVHRLRLELIDSKSLKSFGLLVVAMVPFVLLSFISREHYGDLNDLPATVDMLFYAFASYALGQIYAFSDFFSFYVGQASNSMYVEDYYSFGAYTFSSLHQLFGEPKIFPPGLYLETGYYLDVFETNVFTAFRGFLYDFGVIGSLIVFLILGLFGSLAFYCVLAGRHSYIAGIVFVHLFVFLVITYLFSVFMARYMYSNALGFLFLMHANVIIDRVEQKKLSTAMQITGLRT